MQGKVHRRQIRINGVIEGLLAAAVLFTGELGAVAAPVLYSGSTVSQNFDTPTLANTGTTNTWTNSSTSGTTIDGIINGWWAWQNVTGGATPTAAAVGNYQASTGSINSGALYSYGSAGSNDRALGTLSGGTNTMEFGITLINNSSTTYNSLTIGYTGEQWRNGGNATAQTLAFDYKFNAVNAYDSGFTSVSALNFVSPIHTASAGAIDGNAAPDRQVLSTTISGITWAPGTTLFLRWTDVNDAGNDHGMGIDDFSFDANLVSSAFTWNNGTTWDTTNTNWLNSASAPAMFVSGSDANFTNTNVGTVTVTNPITAGAINVTHTAGTYTVTGAAVTAGVVTQNGIGGTLLINNALTATSVGVSNGTFGGSGTISAPVTLSTGTTLAPGSASGAAGTLTVGNLSITSVALPFDLGANTAASDNIIAGTLTANGTNTFTLADLGTVAPGTYTLIDYTGTALTNLANFTLSNTMLGSKYVYLINNTANTSLDLLVSATPVAFSVIWSGGGGTGTAWLTAANWASGTIPLANDVAVFDAAGTGNPITINFGGLGGATNNGSANQAVGSIRLTGGISHTIQASAAPGTLTLNGANGEWLANTTTSNTLTLQNGSTANTMTVSLATAVTNKMEVTQAGAGIVVNSVITGPGGIEKTGAGTLTLTGSNNYTGGTTVTAGKLLVGNGTNGSATGTLPVLVNGGFLGSTTAGGTISGLTTVAAAATLIPNDIGASSANPLAFTGGLTLLTGATANFDLALATKDLITIAGGLTLPAGGTVNITAIVGSGVTGIVPLFTFDSVANFATTTWGVPGGYTVTLAPSGTEIDLNIPAPNNLTWVGGDAINPDKWDIATSLNWTGDATTFHDGDFVTFNSSSSHLNVTVDAAGVSPGSIAITSGNYSFSGGPIKGSGILTLSGTGTVTLNQTNNTYAGGTQLQSGTLIVMADGSLGAAAGALTLGGTAQPTLKIGAAGFTSTRPISFIGNGAFIDTNGFDTIFAPTTAITLSGPLAKTGTGELMIKSSGFTGTGDIYIVGGTLTLGDKTSATANPAAFVTGINLRLFNATLQIAASSSANAKIVPAAFFATGTTAAPASIIINNTGTSNTISPSIGKPLTLDGQLNVDFVNTTGSDRITFSTLDFINNPAVIKVTTTATYNSNITFSGAANDHGFASTWLGGGSSTQATGGGASGGIFLNSSSSSMTGDWTLGNSAGTEGALLSPNSPGAFTTGNITVNPYSNLVIFNGTDGNNYGATGKTLTLNGIGAQLPPAPGSFPDAAGALSLDGTAPSAAFVAHLLDDVTLASDSVIRVTGTRFLDMKGTISGPGALIKQGPGAIVLQNGNGYLGGTFLNNGKITVNNTSGSATGTGTVTLNGGTLASTTNGIISGAVIAGSAAHIIAPGDVGFVGTLTLGSNLTLNANSTLNFDINATTPAQDHLAITGTLNVSAGTPAITLAVVGTLSGSYNNLATYATSTIPTFNLPTVAGYAWLINATSISLVPAVAGNDSVLATGTSTIAFGRVMTGFVPTTPVSVSRLTGTTTTGFSSTPTGDATATGVGAPGSIPPNGSLTVGVTDITGARSGTVLVQNTGDSGTGGSSAGAGQGNAQTPINISISATVVANRTVTASAVNLGRVMINVAANGSSNLTTTGDNDHFTAITVAGQLFNSAASTGTATVNPTFAIAGPASGSQPLTVIGEGLANESPIPVSAAYTATAVGNRVVLASAVNFTPINPIHVGATTSILTTSLTSAAPDNIATEVTVPNGTDGTVTISGGTPATIFNGTNSDTRNVQATFNTAGVISSTVNLATVGEGLAGESPIPVSVAYSANVFNGNATLNTTGNVNWNTNANWIDSNGIAAAPGTFAGFNADSASFSGAGANVTVDGGPHILAAISFNAPSLFFVSPGTGSLTLAVGGTIHATAGSAATITAPLFFTGSGNIISDAGSIIIFGNGLNTNSATVAITGAGNVHASAVTNTGALSVAGTGAHNFGNIDGAAGAPHLVGLINTIGTAADLSSAGTTSVLGNTVITATRIRQSSLTIGDGASTTGAKLTIPDSSPTYAENSLVPSGNDAFVSVLKTLTIPNAGGFKGTLDLGNNDLIIDYTATPGSSPITSIEAMIRSGYNNGHWNGTGITSSTAALNPGRFALTVIDNQTLPTHFNTFDGIDTSSHDQVIVKFSWVADLDLDGQVTSNDAITFAAHYSEGHAANHQTGDLNYNGVFDSNDAILFAAAYNETLPHLPEPASLGILALGAGALLIKRRK